MAVTVDILFYICDENEAWGSAHGTKYVEQFICQNLSDIQTTIFSFRVPRLRPFSF
jgi:hypothetical protein